jgi:hypothetical protein
MSHAFCAMFAAVIPHRHASGPAFIGAQHAVMVGVAASEVYGQLRLNVRDDHRSVLCHALRWTTVLAVTSPAVATIFAATGAATDVELGAADLAVLVGVEAVEALRRPFGATRLTTGPHFVCAHCAIAIGIERGQTANARLDEIGLGHRSGLTGRGRGLLGQSRATDQGGERNGGQTAGDDGFAH